MWAGYLPSKSPFGGIYDHRCPRGKGINLASMAIVLTTHNSWVLTSVL